MLNSKFSDLSPRGNSRIKLLKFPNIAAIWYGSCGFLFFISSRNMRGKELNNNSSISDRCDEKNSRTSFKSVLASIYFLNASINCLAFLLGSAFDPPNPLLAICLTPFSVKVSTHYQNNRSQTKLATKKRRSAQRSFF